MTNRLLRVLGIVFLSFVAVNSWAEEEENEIKMKFADIPAAVQKILSDAANGSKIETVDKETVKGKVVYEADVVIDGKNYEIKVAEDGKLISKELDTEDEKSRTKTNETAKSRN